MKHHLKLYFQACLALLINITVFGFISPVMISADDDITPVLGGLLLLLVPPVDWIFGRHVYKAFKEATNEEQKETTTRSRSTTRSR
jgi:hypothetical protein